MKIELTDNQAAIISRACEVCARLHMAQADVLTDFAELTYEEYLFIGNTLRQAQPDPKHRSNEQDVLFDIYQVLRHQLAWDSEDNTPETRDYGKQMGVCFDDPLIRGTEPAIKILDKKDNRRIVALTFDELMEA